MNHDGEEYEKECVYTIELLLLQQKLNTTLLINYT